MKLSSQKTKSFVASFLVLFSILSIVSGCSEDISSVQSSEKTQSVISNQDTQKQETVNSESKDATDNQDSTDSKPTTAPAQQTPTQPLTGRLDAHFLDVGQGDCAFIVLPNKQSLLIDAGNSANGTDIIKYIKERGYQKIDYVVATHPHADHIGGMADVINAFQIDKFYMPKISHTSVTFENMLNALKQNNIGINTAKTGVSLLDIPDLKIDIIAPNTENYDDLNNYSAVVKIKFKNNSFLFMGDAERISENEINAGVAADVIKIGHHGSNSSSQPSFISKVSPKHAIISCGTGNSYGHPHAETMKTLQSSGTKIYRTDESGTIIVSSSGNEITVNKKASAIKPNAPPKATTNSENKSSNSSSSSSSVKKNNNSGNTEPTKTTVYITKTGKKYHRGNCSYLRKSKIPISLSEARQGYGPCSKCNPPR